MWVSQMMVFSFGALEFKWNHNRYGNALQHFRFVVQQSQPA